ncbi:MAG: hypothetical protein Q9P90_11955 [candidate division KSB1 bacterium]|nr:hypothetical protein [candidate division KSB1 bacterium]
MTRRMFVTLWLLSLFGAGPATAQSTGIPLLSGGENEFALTVQAGLAGLTVHDDRHQVLAIVTRPTFGLGRFADVYALLGMARQNVDYGDPQKSAFDGKSSLLYGAGLALQWPWRGPGRTLLFGTAQVAFFRPGGTSYENLDSQNSGLRRIRNTTYEWMQIQASFNLAYPTANARFFVGLELVVRNIRTVTTVKLQQDQSIVPVNRISLPYLKQTQLAPTLGFNVRLPHRHQFGLQLRGTGPGDFGLFLGISQTGALD